MLPSVYRALQPDTAPHGRAQEGLEQMLRDFFPLSTPDQRTDLQFVSYAIRPGQLWATLRLVVWSTDHRLRTVDNIREQPVLIADLPDLDQPRPLRLTLAPGLHRPAPGEVEIRALVGPTIRMVRRRATTVTLGRSRRIPEALLRAALGITAGAPPTSRDEALCAVAEAHSRRTMTADEAWTHLGAHFFSPRSLDLSRRGRLNLLYRLGHDVDIEQHALAVADLDAALRLLRDDPDAADEPGDLSQWRAADTGTQLVDALRAALRKARPALVRRLSPEVMPREVLARLALRRALLQPVVPAACALGEPHPSWQGRLERHGGVLRLAPGARVNALGLIDPAGENETSG